MKITFEKQIGHVKIKSGALKAYRSEPSNIHLACFAAAWLANKRNKIMIIIAGNSYMNKVYQILSEDDDITKVTVIRPKEPIRVIAAQPDGKLFNVLVN